MGTRTRTRGSMAPHRWRDTFVFGFVDRGSYSTTVALTKSRRLERSAWSVADVWRRPSGTGEIAAGTSSVGNESLLSGIVEGDLPMMYAF